MWVVGCSDYNFNVFSLTNSSLVCQIQRQVSLHKLYMIVSKLLKTYNQHKLFLKIKNIASWVIKHFTLSPSSHSYALCILIRILHPHVSTLKVIRSLLLIKSVIVFLHLILCGLYVVLWVSENLAFLANQQCMRMPDKIRFYKTRRDYQMGRSK